MGLLRKRFNKKGELTGYAAVFYDPLRHPKEKYVTLRTKDERVANRKLVDLEKKESLGQFDPWTDMAPREGVLVENAIKEYVKKRKGHRRPRTIQADESTLNLFAASLPPACLLTQIETRHVQAFLHRATKPRTPKKNGESTQKRKKMSSSTRQTYYTRIRAFIMWCNENGMMRHDPTMKVERPKLSKKEKSFFTHDQYQALRRKIDADATMKGAGPSARDGEIRWLLDVMEVAVSTGLRIGELVHMRWSWVNFGAGQIVVQANEDDGFIPKSHHQRTIPVSGEPLDVLRRLHDVRVTEADDYVLRGLDSGDKLDATFVSKRFKEYVLAANIPETFTFHTLRHTFCTWMIQAGVSVPVVQKLAGHANIATTMQYVHVAGGDLHDAITKMHERRERLAEANSFTTSHRSIVAIPQA